MGEILRLTRNANEMHAGTTGGVFKTSDGGGTWERASDGISDPSIVALALAPSNPQTLYAGTPSGVFKTTEAAGTWSPESVWLSNPNTAALSIDPADEQTLYVGTTTGVFKSTDAGDSWHALNDGLTMLDVRALVTDPRASASAVQISPHLPYRIVRPVAAPSAHDFGTGWHVACPALVYRTGGVGWK